MKISNRFNRIAAIITAAVLLITAFISIIVSGISLFTSFRYLGFWPIARQVITVLFATASSLLTIVALLRGKKDTLAGVLFAVPLVQILLNGLLNLFNLGTSLVNAISWSGFTGTLICMMAGTLITLVASLVSAVFRGLTVQECFKPGKISGNVMKWGFVALPVVSIVIAALATFVNQLYWIEGNGFLQYLLTVGMQVLMSAILSIGTVLLGITFLIPVYEPSQQEEDTATAEAEDPAAE